MDNIKEVNEAFLNKIVAKSYKQDISIILNEMSYNTLVELLGKLSICIINEKNLQVCDIESMENAVDMITNEVILRILDGSTDVLDEIAEYDVLTDNAFDNDWIEGIYNDERFSALFNKKRTEAVG
jgi:hypothetical protein